MVIRNAFYPLPRRHADAANVAWRTGRLSIGEDPARNPDEDDMNHAQLLSWLRESDSEQLESLWQRADDVRRQHVGDEVYLRGLIEFSNCCVRSCAYCGLRVSNRELIRYRMTAG